MKLEINQRLWDERNCREIEIVKFNGAAYYCKIIDPAGDDAEGVEGYTWFRASELRRLKPAR